MVARTRRIALAAALLTLLPGILPAPMAAAQLGPVPEGATIGLQAPALHALDSRLRAGPLYLVADNTPQVYVGDQMMGVLFNLYAAQFRPDEASRWQGRAVELWSLALQAFDAPQDFFHKTIPPPDRSVCIDVETHAWALRGALALRRGGHLAPATAKEWTDRLRAIVSDLLDTGSHSGTPACGLAGGKLNPFNVPLATWALLDSLDLESDGRAASVARARTNEFIAGFRQGAFADPAAFYNVVLNARLLVVLSEAAKRFGDGIFAQKRDELADALAQRFVMDENGAAIARHLGETSAGLRASGDSGPLNQFWTAFALHAAGPRSPERNTTIQRLLDAALTRFWSPSTGGFAKDNGPLLFEPNAMAALFFRSPALTNVVPDVPNLSFVVPNRVATLFGADDSLVLGRAWTVRFSLASNATGTRDVLLAAQSLASLNLSAGPQEDIRLYRLSQTGGPRQDVPLAPPLKGRTDVIRFTTDLTSTPAPYRLDAFAPLSPVSATWGDFTIRLTIRNDADAVLVARPLRLELIGTQLNFTAALLNDGALALPEKVGPITTEEVSVAHLRLLFSEVALTPGENELTLRYLDSARPQVQEFRLYRDPQAAEALPEEGRLTVYKGETLYARARVTDNGALRSVFLSYVGDSKMDHAMREVSPGVYQVGFRVGNNSGTARLFITAIDAARNLNPETKEYDLKIEDPLFSGSIVLLVFAGTLFATAFIIWMKLRRKGPGV